MYGSSSTVTVPRRHEPIESRRSFRLGTSPRKPSSSVYGREYRYNGNNDHRARKTVASPTTATTPTEAKGDCSHPAWPTPHGDTLEDADTPNDVHEPHLFSEEAFYPASYAHRPCPAPGTWSETIHTAKPKQSHGRGDGRGTYCQGGHNCSTPPSYSVDGRKPAVLCGSHREHGMYRVFHDNRNCGHKGCGRLAQVRYMSEDGKINRFCPKHKNPDVIVTRNRRCQYAGCDSAPLYGVKGGPQSFCREHKRAGMFTSRNGELLVATRDGSAYRAEVSAAENSSAKDASAARAVETPRSPVQPVVAEPPEDSSSSHQETRTSAYSPGKMIPLNRRLCEVPGCMVQPSYGETGTGRPRFCSGHKKKGMVGLKNRPCLFPGCDTRPHYGLSGGRPQFCASHKSDEMIHLLKESMSRVRVRAPRKKKEKRPTETKKEDRPAAAESTEIKFKVSDLKETAGEGDDKALGAKEASGGERGNENERPEEEQETRVMVRAKRKRSRRNVATAATGTAGTSGTAGTAGTATAGTAETTGTTGTAGTGGTKVKISSPKLPAKVKISSPKPPALTPPSASSPASSSSSSSSSSSGLPASPSPATEGALCASAEDAETSPTSTAETSPSAEQSPPASRMAEAPGMAPSIEIRLLREARESAKAAAAANGSGRRARAPSRKALEASGKMSSEGAQWMTREKKEELARAKRELKEQRRAAAAAGLKTGHVIEACAIPVASDAGDGGGGGDRGAGGRGGVAVPSSPNWRKLSPAEILEAAARQPATEKANPKAHDKGAANEPKANPKAHDNGANVEPNAAVGGGKQRGRGVSPVAVEASKEPAKKRKKPESKVECAPVSDVDKGKEPKRGRKTKEAAGDDNNDRVEQAPNKEVKKRRRRRGKEEVGGGITAAGEAAGSTTICEFESCSKAAMYGSNGTARFCKTHRLPGLHKINKK